jgi:antitoxin component YwqK of YwqJK toxin-antitoxin module
MFEGYFTAGKKDGIGQSFWENGQRDFVGYWKDDSRCGKGILYRQSGGAGGLGQNEFREFIGMFADGKKNGLGIELAPGPEHPVIIYQGQYQNDLKHGPAIVYYESGAVLWEGEFSEGKKSGLGVSYHENGGIWFKGNWKHDSRHRQGTEFYPDGNV